MRLLRLQHAPGFRLNLPDVVIVAGCLGLSAWLRDSWPDTPLWWLPGYAAVSFLLFCNVMRIGTVLELPWLLAAACATVVGTAHEWDLAVAVPLAAEPFRLMAAVWAARIGWWRGVCWRRIAAANGIEPAVIEGPRPPLAAPWRPVRRR